MSTTHSSRVVSSGVTELATGALSGWVYTLARTQPETARSLGIVNTVRIRQWHIDLIMMGTAKIAIGLAVEDAPRAAATALRVGSWTNAMAFLPMAFKPDVDKHPAFLGAAIASFVATTYGFTGLALARRRQRRRT